VGSLVGVEEGVNVGFDDGSTVDCREGVVDILGLLDNEGTVLGAWDFEGTELGEADGVSVGALEILGINDTEGSKLGAIDADGLVLGKRVIVGFDDG
jgi:hypothetical protein